MHLIHLYEQVDDDFYDDLIQNKNSIFFFRHDMIACLGETTGNNALQNILQTMKESEEGSQILIERPRINSGIIDLNALEKLPSDTFGYAYKKFLNDNVSIITSQWI